MARLTDEEIRKRLKYRMTQGGLRGYYIGFGHTGQEPVDLILAAVADAAKAYHHTEGWNELCLAPVEGREEYSHADVIQAAAEIAARDLATARELLEEAREWMLGPANAHAEQSPPGPCICDWCVTCRRIAAFLAGPEAR